jgi:hypothetical protein
MIDCVRSLFPIARDRRCLEFELDLCSDDAEVEDVDTDVDVDADADDEEEEDIVKKLL